MNSNDKQFLAQKIRTQYMDREPSELDALRELDSKVKRPANVFAYVFGSIGAVIMGAGMSLVMTDVGAKLGMNSTMAPRIIIGIVGMLMALVNYLTIRFIKEFSQSAKISTALKFLRSATKL